MPSGSREARGRLVVDWYLDERTEYLYSRQIGNAVKWSSRGVGVMTIVPECGLNRTISVRVAPFLLRKSAYIRKASTSVPPWVLISVVVCLGLFDEHLPITVVAMVTCC